MDKKEKIANVYNAVHKARDKLLRQRAADYFAPFKDKSWYENAVNAYCNIVSELSKVFGWYRDEVVKQILSMFNTEPIKKAKKYKTWEYLDSKHNFVTVDDIEDKLISLHQELLKKLKDFFKAHIINKVVVNFVKDLISTEQVPFNFNSFNKFTKSYLEKKMIKWAKEVKTTTENIVRRQLVNGYEQGLGITDIANSIKQHAGFKASRAEGIARTEVMSACNYVDYATYNLDSNVIGYTWQTCQDNRVRSSHISAQGQYRPVGKPFNIGGYKMMHPGDQSLGAPAKEIIMCRCWLYPVYKGEKIPGEE